MSDTTETTETAQADTATPETNELDTALRPRTLDEFVGQFELVQRLRLWLRAALDRGEPLDHTVFSGPPGLGKTTLANLIAAHTGARLYNVNGASVAKPADLLGTLCKLKRGDVLFIDEIHRLPRTVEEYLYTAMEDWRVDVTTEKNGTVSFNLQRFTLVGATTRLGQLAPPFRARFKIAERLDPYDLESLTTIAQANGAKLGLALAPQAGEEIARRCRGTPRRVVTFLARLRDVAQINQLATITPADCEAVAQIIGLDGNGLDPMDRRILQALESAHGKAIGLTSLGQMVNEEPRTIEETHEPYLIQQGYIIKQPRGRMITDAGRAALGVVL